MRSFFSIFAFCLLSLTAFAQPKVTQLVGQSAASALKPLLPNAFAGWRSPKTQTSKDAGAVDAANAAVLHEYGFVDSASATYARDDGRQLTLKAARFQDASGAYGAFTFYRTPQMQAQEIGDQGASIGQRVLFFRGNVLIDAVFTRLSEMSAAELRELAQKLPVAGGTEAKLPDLPGYLPGKSLVKNSAKYLLGPLALESAGGLLTSRQIDFSQGAEVVTAQYNVAGSSGTLMLIGYPTSQIATAKLKEFEGAQQMHQLSDSQIALRRTGRIVVLGGGLPQDAANSLVSEVNYDADVTWNQNTYHNPKDNVGRVVLGGIFLAAVLCGLLLVASIAFGGFRVAMNRFLPGKVFDRPDQVELIALHLNDSFRQEPEKAPAESIQAR